MPAGACSASGALRRTSSPAFFTASLPLLLPQVILLFPHAFWGSAWDTFGQVAAQGGDRGESFLFYSYADIAGGALLIALSAGVRVRASVCVCGGGRGVCAGGM